MIEEMPQDRSGLSPRYQTYECQKCFIAYTEQAEWSNDLLSACQEVLSQPEFNLEPDYARKHFHPDIPLRQKALELIANARYGIYDLSYWRDEKGEWQMPRNVFIELGMAIALNRPTLLLRHAKNRELELPECLKSVSGHILEFSGETTLKRALEERLPQWVNEPPERDWWNRYCIFGSRVCEFREVNPRARQRGQRTLHCHISDGPDLDRDDFRGVIQDVLGRFSDVTFDYLDALSVANGYDFLLCSHCQTVRSTPFAIYRITSRTQAETFVAIGISTALEAQYGYSIPKILLTEKMQDVPSLLFGYEVIEARNDKVRRTILRTFIPTVTQKVRETAWKPRPLPFIEVSIPQDVERASLAVEALALLRNGELSELLRQASTSPSIYEFVEERLRGVKENLPSVEINEILEQHVSRLRAKAPYQSLDCQLKLAIDDSTRVRAHSEWLQRVFDILTENAVEAMANSPNQRLAISAGLRDNGIEIAFSDTGPGIPRSLLPTLLREPIEKGDGEIGIGLLLARTIIEAFGGNLSVKFTSPEGTTVSVWLPVEVKQGRTTILLADNDLGFLASGRQLLEAKGYTVVTATNPTEAKSVLHRGQVDLAILDLRLEDDNEIGDRSGLDLAKEVTFRDIPKILISAYPTPNAVREALGTSLNGQPLVSDFIIKDEGPDALLQAISRALETVVEPDQKLREAEVSSLAELRRKTFEFLVSLPLHSENERRLLIAEADLNPVLVSRLNYGGPTAQFLQMLIHTLLAYGRLNDGRDALEAVLEAAKDYVGQDRKEHCNALIREWRAHRQLSGIPIVTDIAASLGGVAEENIEEYLLLDDEDRTGADFGVRVAGDSMKDLDILSGDIALIGKQPTVRNGEIVAAVIGTSAGYEAVLRRYYAYNEHADLRHWFLQPGNPASEYLVIIPWGADVKAIQALYEVGIRSGRIGNPIRFYEDAELLIVGKCVGLVRNKTDRVNVQAVSKDDVLDVFDFAGADVQILVADDDPDIRSLIRLIVRKEGYSSVKEASSGQEVLTLLESEPYVLMILDSKLPGMDWREVVHRAYELRPELSVILTGYRAMDAEIAALKVETVASYLSKPFAAEDLAASVNQALQKQAKR